MSENKWLTYDETMNQLFPEVDEDDPEYRFCRMMDQISIAIVDYRVAHGMTQTDLARFLGVSQAMVSKYESGDYNFTLKTLSDLSVRLGLSLSFAFEAKEKAGAAAAMDAGYMSYPSQNVPANAEPLTDQGGVA